MTEKEEVISYSKLINKESRKEGEKKEEKKRMNNKESWPFFFYFLKPCSKLLISNWSEDSNSGECGSHSL